MSVIQATVTVSLGKDTDEQASVEVCGSGHNYGDKVALKIYLPKKYKITRFSYSLEGVSGASLYKSREYETITEKVTEDISFSTENLTGAINKTPTDEPNRSWLGYSIGTAIFDNKEIKIVPHDPQESEKIAVDKCDNEEKTKADEIELGILRVVYNTKAVVYILSVPEKEVMDQLGDPPIPVDILFQAEYDKDSL